MTRPETERLAVVETEIRHLRLSIESIETKIDGLISLRDQGKGIVWFLALSAGGIAALIAATWHWLRG